MIQDLTIYMKKIELKIF